MSQAKVVPLYPEREAAKPSQDELRRAAELLAQNLSLDTTLGEVLKDPRSRSLPNEPITGATLPLFPEAVIPSEARRPKAEDTQERSGRTEGRDHGSVGSPIPKRSRRTVNGERHARTIDLFVRLWSEVRGGTYEVFGARDGSAVKRLLALPGATDEEIERRMRRALSEPFFQRAGNLAFFVSRWSTYDRDAQPAGQRAPAQSSGSSRRVVGMNADGSFRYAE